VEVEEVVDVCFYVSDEGGGNDNNVGDVSGRVEEVCC